MSRDLPDSLSLPALEDKRNFAQFNYVNEQNNQLEQIREQIAQVREVDRSSFLCFPPPCPGEADFCLQFLQTYSQCLLYCSEESYSQHLGVVMKPVW